ncbi:MAG: hypothetical protein HY926_02145 [Elusimicrobia bacterium]|nr:hypothetical protein [Elusimicrobiota bacterium]
MDPSRPRRLALRLTWTPRCGPRRRWGLAFDPVPWLLPLAVTAAVLLAAAWVRFAPLRPDPPAHAAALMKPLSPMPASPPGAQAPLPAPGQAMDEKGDVITPLNVRDPAALVLGPGGSSPPPAVVPDVKGAPVPPARKRSKKMKNEDWRKPENYRF